MPSEEGGVRVTKHKRTTTLSFMTGDFQHKIKKPVLRVKSEKKKKIKVMRSYSGNLKVTEHADIPQTTEQKRLAKRTGLWDNIGHITGSWRCNSLQGPLPRIRGNQTHVLQNHSPCPNLCTTSTILQKIKC